MDKIVGKHIFWGYTRPSFLHNQSPETSVEIWELWMKTWHTVAGTMQIASLSSAHLTQQPTRDQYTSYAWEEQMFFL
jgi:hypothetical protein